MPDKLNKRPTTMRTPTPPGVSPRDLNPTASSLLHSLCARDLSWPSACFDALAATEIALADKGATLTGKGHCQKKCGRVHAGLQIHPPIRNFEANTRLHNAEALLRTVTQTRITSCHSQLTRAGLKHFVTNVTKTPRHHISPFMTAIMACTLHQTMALSCHTLNGTGRTALRTH